MLAHYWPRPEEIIDISFVPFTPNYPIHWFTEEMGSTSKNIFTVGTQLESSTIAAPLHHNTDDYHILFTLYKTGMWFQFLLPFFYSFLYFLRSCIWEERELIWFHCCYHYGLTRAHTLYSLRFSAATSSMQFNRSSITRSPKLRCCKIAGDLKTASCPRWRLKLSAALTHKPHTEHPG